MYKKGAGNDKQRKDAGNRKLCPYRNFNQAISSRTTLAVGLYTRISCDVMLIAPESVDNKISIKIYDPWESIFLPGTDKYPVTKFLQKQEHV